MMNHFRFLSLSGIAASLIVLTSCASSTTTNSAPDGSASPAASPAAETSAASPAAETSAAASPAPETSAAASPTAETSAAASPTAETSAASPTAETTSQIDLNSASDPDLEKLAIKLSIPDFAEKLKQNRPYTDVNDLVVKQILTPEQLELIKTDITVVKTGANTP